MVHRHSSIVVASLGLALTLGANWAMAETSHFFGRWTVSDDKPVYSSKGKIYKTFDVAPCGKDFCGVAVADDNSCGRTLFRFLTIHADNEEITGHGMWGAQKKKLQVGYVAPQDAKPYVYLGLGADDMDFSGREGSTPTFQANYKSAGEAKCMAK